MINYWRVLKYETYALFVFFETTWWVILVAMIHSWFLTCTILFEILMYVLAFGPSCNPNKESKDCPLPLDQKLKNSGFDITKTLLVYCGRSLQISSASYYLRHYGIWVRWQNPKNIFWSYHFVVCTREWVAFCWLFTEKRKKKENVRANFSVTKYKKSVLACFLITI